MDFNTWFNEFLIIGFTKDPAKKKFFTETVPQLFDTEVAVFKNKLYLVIRFIVEEKDREIEQLKQRIKELENDRIGNKVPPVSQNAAFDTVSSGDCHWSESRPHPWPGL